MFKLFEKYGDEASAKDGGFVFQAIISHDVKWEIVNGETSIDPKTINSILHQVDVFPDIKFTEGSATSTYVILSEVNILKRKFELASEAIKKRLVPEYAAEMEALAKEGLTSEKRKEVTLRHFKNSHYTVDLTTDHIVLREVSTSGIDTGLPRITLKISTGMVDTLNGQPTDTWKKFKVTVDGTKSLTIDGVGEDAISTIREYDEIEKVNELVFRTIVPSLILEFKGDRVSIDTLSNRSAQIAVGGTVDYDNIFSTEDVTKGQQAPTTKTTNK